jgi:hypothetical protein
MGTIDLKSNLHKLIDAIENPKLLASIYDILESKRKTSEGSLWSALTESQKSEVLDACEESDDASNLILHSDIVRELK